MGEQPGGEDWPFTQHQHCHFKKIPTIIIIISSSIIIISHQSYGELSGEAGANKRLWLLRLCCHQSVGGDQASGDYGNDAENYGNDDDDNGAIAVYFHNGPSMY